MAGSSLALAIRASQLVRIAAIGAIALVCGCAGRKARNYHRIEGPFHLYEEVVSVGGCDTSRFYLVHIEHEVVTEIAGPVLDRWAVHGDDIIVFYDRSQSRESGLYVYKHGSGIRVIATTPDLAWRSDADGISWGLTQPPPNPRMPWSQVEDLFRK